MFPHYSRTARRATRDVTITKASPQAGGGWGQNKKHTPLKLVAGPVATECGGKYDVLLITHGNR